MLVSRGERPIDTARLVEDAVLVAFVGTIIYTDWRWRRIPNLATYPAMAIGLVLGLFEGLGAAGEGLPGALGAPFVGGLLDHLAGLALGFVVTFPFYAARGMKAGDVKLLMAIGALRGATFLLPAAFYGAMLGGLIALGVIAARRLARPAPGEAPNTMGRILHTWIPYGVALGAGALVALAVELKRA